MPNFGGYFNNRRAGGPTIFIKQNLADHLESVSTEIPDTLVAEFRKTFSDNPLLMIVTYIPPHNSPHADITRIDVLENTINEWLTDNVNGNVCIVGGFNARTGTLNDTLGVPDYADSFLDGPATDVVYSNTTHTRANSDKTVNKFGSRLIELCKSLNMYIANGRCGNDKDVGSPTSKGISTVDYVVVTESLLNKIVHFFNRTI